MEEKKRDYRNIIILILLIIIIILLLVRCGDGMIQKETVVPTSKTNVFDIDVNVNYRQYILDENGNVVGIMSGDDLTSGEGIFSGGNGGTSTGNHGDGKDTSENAQQNQNPEIENGQTNSGDITIISGDVIVTDKHGYEVPIIIDDEPMEDGKVYVDDKNGNFVYQQELAIFKNSNFYDNNKIAPGVSGVYEFTVHNSSKDTVMYYIQMKETTEYPVNMKYRLKKDGAYVVGNASTWVSADQLITQNTALKKQSDDKYLLEWQWMHSDEADTIAGSLMESSYQLRVFVNFES